MIEPILFVASEGASTDRESNTLSVFSIIEDIQAPSFPIAFPRIVVSSLVRRDDSDPASFDAKLTVKINDLELASFPVRIDFLDKLRVRNTFMFGGLLVPSPGLLVFRLKAETQGLDLKYVIPCNQTGSPQLTLGLTQVPQKRPSGSNSTD